MSLDIFAPTILLVASVFSTAILFICIVLYRSALRIRKQAMQDFREAGNLFREAESRLQSIVDIEKKLLMKDEIYFASLGLEYTGQKELALRGLDLLLSVHIVK